MTQSVMVFEASILEELGGLQGHAFEVDRYLSKILSPGNFTFIPRNEAEGNLRYKQIIPYIVLRYDDRVFTYVRGQQSSERRLVRMRSIGVGGHVEPKDQDSINIDGGFYYNAARREVYEEVEVGTDYTERIIALINDDSNDVGRVHFGIVHVWDLEQPMVKNREDQISESGFISITELRKLRNELETWSQIALDALEPSSPS